MNDKYILFIGQTPADIQACKSALQQLNSVTYHITPVASVKEAEEKLCLSKFDCLIIDFYLPGTSGFELIKSLRKSFVFIPIVVLTMEMDEAAEAELIKSGAQDYIKKTDISAEGLHLVISEAIRRATVATQKSQVQSKHCNLLLIDDNPDDIEFCVRSLKRKSQYYRYHTASSGEEGLACIESFLPDCIVLDHSLPGSNGLDILSIIHESYPFIPVIILTGQGDELIAVQAMRRGAENYLIKSKLDAEVLDKSITAAVEKKRLESELAKKELALAKKQAELSAAYSFQDMVIESLPDLLFVKDSEFRIVKANQAFMQLYPNRDKVIGYTTVEHYSEGEAEAFLQQDKQAFDTGYSEILETITFPNGETRTLFTQKKRFVDAFNQAFILGVAKDVTERENLIKQLRKSNQDLEQFAYVASHDLKSPLNGIKRLVTWIEEDHGATFPKEALRHFSLIKSRAQRMTNLLNDLLEYSRVNKHLQLEEEIELRAFCHDIFSLIENSHQFSLRVPEVKVNLPRVALQLVLLNLISNAIKHHNKSSGKIGVNISQCPAGYQIVVVDDGPGIPVSYKDKVFQMFQTLKPRDEVEGSGMGLALVKKIVEHYSGHIELDVKYGPGCQFLLFWPIKNNSLKPIKEKAEQI